MFVSVVLTLVLAAKPPPVWPPSLVAPGGFDPRQGLLDAIPESNGHGRAQGNRKPVARMANSIVESSKRLSAAEELEPQRALQGRGRPPLIPGPVSLGK